MSIEVNVNKIKEYQEKIRDNRNTIRNYAKKNRDLQSALEDIKKDLKSDLVIEIKKGKSLYQIAMDVFGKKSWQYFIMYHIIKPKRKIEYDI